MKARNIRLLEEGFSEAYHRKLKEESIARAEKWTSKRFEIELMLIEVVYDVILRGLRSGV